MMKRTIAVAFMLAAFGTFVAAQEEVPLKPKPPTASQAKMLVTDAVRTARSLNEVEDKLKEIDAQAVATKMRIDVHNAQHPSGQCTYTEQNPNACDGWITEAAELNAAAVNIIRQRERQMFRKAELRGNLSMRLARLRMMKLLEGLTEWEQEVVACSRLNRDADRGCLIAAWERHP